MRLSRYYDSNSISIFLDSREIVYIVSYKPLFVIFLHSALNRMPQVQDI